MYMYTHIYIGLVIFVAIPPGTQNEYAQTKTHITHICVPTTQPMDGLSWLSSSLKSATLLQNLGIFSQATANPDPKPESKTSTGPPQQHVAAPEQQPASTSTAPQNAQVPVCLSMCLSVYSYLIMGLLAGAWVNVSASRYIELCECKLACCVHIDRFLLGSWYDRYDVEHLRRQVRTTTPLVSFSHGSCPYNMCDVDRSLGRCLTLITDWVGV